jgi:predicted small secreted protein
MAHKEAEMKKLALLVPLVLALALSACNSGSESGAGSTGGGRAAEGSVEASPNATKASDRAVSSSAVPQVGPQVVKTASLRLGLAKGSFEDKVGEAHAVADSFGGFVVESFASQGSGKRIAEGSLVLRIPAESYDSALVRLRELGRVESLEESGQDVSKEFVDLNARVRQLRAVEAQLLELLQRADDVPAALAVQNQLSQVQLDLEQARGRLQYLDNRVAFATISMSMHELAVVAPKDGGFKIVDAWATAGSAFLTVVGWLFIGIAVAAPVLILLGLGFLVGRQVRRLIAHA